MKFIPLDTSSGYNLAQINANFDDIANALNNEVLYRNNPAGEPNEMQNILDMNGKQIINLPAPATLNSAVRLQDILDLAGGTIGIGAAITTSFSPTSYLPETNVQGALEHVGKSATASGTSVNVDTVGATGDGVVDDWTAITAAIAAVAALGGGEVVLSAKRYLVSKPIIINSPNIVIRGVSKTASVITITNNASAFTGATQGVINLAANNTGVKHLAIDGNAANNTLQASAGIMSNGGFNGLAIEDNLIYNTIYSGILLQNNSGSTPYESFTICRNDLKNIGWDGIFVQYGLGGKIDANRIISTGANGIRTDCIGTTNTFGTGYTRINGNYINKAVPPSYIVGGYSEGAVGGGFMIVLGSVDKYMTISYNICYDNRNAGQDGIGLGQDQTFNSVGIVCVGNVVRYAGLFGIDSMGNSIVSGNFIEYATSDGIKVGTDNGGNQTNLIIANNIVANSGNPTAKWNLASVSNVSGISIYPGGAPATYFNHTVTGNQVYDNRTGAAQLTKYGLKVGFNAGNFFYANCIASGNDFSAVAVSSISADGTGAPTDGSWTFGVNVLKTPCPTVSGVTPAAYGVSMINIVQSGATTLTNILGGFEGMRLFIRFADGNTTIPYSGGAFVGNAGANKTYANNTAIELVWHASVWYLV